MDQSIGRYRILEEIASGSQGAVYRGFDPQEGRIVALKVLHPSLTADPAYLERFHREAQMAAAIDHPNVVKVFEVGESGGRHFIAMEFLPESLARILDTGDVLPVGRAVQFTAQIADGLAAAHALGIVHRDVKPQNVLIGPNGEAKVTDFGIARAAALSNMTATGMIMGTPYYMSPEQANGQPTDARSDVYSLGCVLYQMLTGELPFPGETPLTVLRRHVEEQPRPVRSLRSDVPPAVASAVERAMAKDPARRFQSMGELIAALQSSVPGLSPPITQTAPTVFAPGQAIPGPLPTLSDQPLSRGPLRAGWWINGGWRNKYLLGGALVSLVAVMVAVGYLAGVLPIQAADPAQPAVIGQPPGPDTDVPRPTVSSGDEVADRQSSGGVGEDIRKQTSPTAEYIPVINATVEDLQFFEVADFYSTAPPTDQWIHEVRFSKGTTRYIGWRLALTHPAPGRRIDYFIEAVYYRADGSELARHSKPAYVESTWTSSWWWSAGFGDVSPGNWSVGVYRVNLSVNNDLVASREFEVVADAAIAASPVAAPEFTEGRVLFEDNFESGIAGDWDLLSPPDEGLAVIQDANGNYVLRANGTTGSISARAGDSTWKNYALEFTAKFLETTSRSYPPRLSVTVRQNRIILCDWYNINLGVEGEGGTKIARTRVKDNECIIEDLAGAPGFSLERDRWYSIRVEALGPRITVYVDGQLLMFADDPEPNLRGGIWFHTRQGHIVHYDDVRVVELVPSETTPGKVPFLEMAARSALESPDASFSAEALQVALGRRPEVDEDFSDISSRFGERQSGGDYPRYVDGQYLMATHPNDSCCNGSRILGNYTDLVVQLDMRLDSFEGNDQQWGSLALRRTQGVGFYSFDLRLQGQMTWYEVRLNYSGIYTVIESGNLPVGSDLAVGAWHNVIVVFRGNQIAYFIDGSLVEAFTDDTLSQGGFNMFAGWGTSVSIEDFKLWDIGDLK